MSSEHSKSKTLPILLVFGPTASGKTHAAIALAQEVGGEIINADSMQLYKGLPTLTALPSRKEQAGIAHHLFGTVPPDQPWSTGIWLDAIAPIVRQIQARGRRPILVGGTGLYFEALTKGLAQIPNISKNTQLKVSQLAQEKGLEYLREQLERVDPQAASRILGADRQRLIRALSVYQETGKSLTSFQQNTQPVFRQDQWQGAVLLPKREQLYARIEARFDQMLATGALDELQEFCRAWPELDLPLFKAIGVPSLLKVLNGEMALVDATAQAKRDTRRYAKRQMTWARGRTASWLHVDDAQGVFKLCLS
ncbi:MAG: tRNA (adenosine(37)-N6)-dimethylallyltransferase MiaA [Robiginitomaculum sp.]|nr:tRNA (adenosine(37)-N6)-dimethylallyltransferase MiaA [Robiginitomaculum sp.]